MNTVTCNGETKRPLGNSPLPHLAAAQPYVLVEVSAHGRPKREARWTFDLTTKRRSQGPLLCFASPQFLEKGRELFKERPRRSKRLAELGFELGELAELEAALSGQLALPRGLRASGASGALP